MKIKCIRKKEKDNVSYFWLILAYSLVLKHTKKSRKRKQLARKIIHICKMHDGPINKISDDYRYWTAKKMYDNIVNK